jgi:hypothetical protein
MRPLLCLVGDNVVLWTWDADGHLLVPRVLRPETLTADEHRWLEQEIQRRTQGGSELRCDGAR